MEHVRVILALMVTSSSTFSQQTVFSDVMVHQRKSDNDHRIVERSADLVLDDAARRLRVKTKQAGLDVAYDDVTKVIFEGTRHMRGMNKKYLLVTIAGGALAGALVAGGEVKDYFCYFEVKTGDGSPKPYLIEIGKSSVSEVKARIKSVFRNRIHEGPTLEGEPINKNALL